MVTTTVVSLWLPGRRRRCWGAPRSRRSPPSR